MKLNFDCNCFQTPMFLRYPNSRLPMSLLDGGGNLGDLMVRQTPMRATVHYAQLMRKVNSFWVMSACDYFIVGHHAVISLWVIMQ